MRQVLLPLIACLFINSGFCQNKPVALYPRIMAAINNHDASTLNLNDYEEIENNIISGNSNYIALYPAFINEPFLGSASFQEGIDTALALALPVNVSAVLQQVNDRNIKDVCGMPFIEPTRNFIYRYYDRTRASLASAGKRGARCLVVLDAEMSDIKKAEKAGEMLREAEQ